MHHMMRVLQQPWANMAAPSSFSKVAGVVERVATDRQIQLIDCLSRHQQTTAITVCDDIDPGTPWTRERSRTCSK
jgi:hypothetical protein